VSKLKNLSRAGWVIVGLVIALLLVPTVAVASALTYNGIEGTNGVTTTQNKASVTNGGQLLTTEANQSRTFQCSFNGITGAPSGTAQFSASACDVASGAVPDKEIPVITTLQIDTYSDPSPGSGDYFIAYTNNPDGTASSPRHTEVAYVNPPSVGTTVIPFSPGVPTASVDSGFQLFTYVAGISVNLIVTGYYVPCTEDEVFCTT
jgi:hypothetical protein